MRVLFHQIGISLVYCLIYSRRAVYYSPVYTRLRGAKLYSIGNRVFSWSTLAPYTLSKTRTSRNVRNGAERTHRNRAIMHKQLFGFSDFYEGLIIRERIK